MWIRSQDKETLILAEEISSWRDANDSKLFYVSAYSNILGTYSSREKALKVLDMIQGCITGNVLQSYEIARDCPLAGIEFNGVFNMPQDNEVES